VNQPNRIDRTSVTLSIARQTPKDEFGDVLSSTLNNLAKSGGALIGGMTGLPIVSAAVSSVTALANSSSRGQASTIASPGVGISAGAMSPPGIGSTVALGASPAMSQAVAGAAPAGMDNYLSSMRAEADRSMMVQMQMQQESREYNTLTNVLKLRHDSAKAAINNIR
jgi:hypothetical protein